MRALLLRLSLGCWCLSLSSCGIEKETTSSLMFAPSSNECKVLGSVYSDIKIPNKGYGTLTITHPEIVSHFTFTKTLAKFTQVKSIDDEQELVRRLIRSFLVTRVATLTQEQPLRPFVIREFMCKLLDDNVPKPAFCGNLFFSNQAAAVTQALAFIDSKQKFTNFGAIDTLLRPLTFIKRPPRVDLHASEQTVEARVVYGLRDLDGTTRLPATLILEFAGTSQKEFYENLVKLFIQFKDRNDTASRDQWAFGIEFALDRFLASNAGIADRWAINQIRVNELAFRDTDILWNFREYNFPSANSSVNDFSQVPVANTPWVDFEMKDKDPGLLNPQFLDFLTEQGLTADEVNSDPEKSIDTFETFMGSTRVKVKDSPKLQNFVQTLNRQRNDSGIAGSKAFPYHLNATWMAPSALARPGMRFFEGDTAWSKNLKETCQGCHVSESSISADERIESTQGFYHVSPRKEPAGANVGATLAGANVLSPFLLRETRLRYKSLMNLVGCNTAALTASDPSLADDGAEELPMVGHSSGAVTELSLGEQALIPSENYICAIGQNQHMAHCTSRRSRDAYACDKGHTELARCEQSDGTFWLITCEGGAIGSKAYDSVPTLSTCDRQTSDL